MIYNPSIIHPWPQNSPPGVGLWAAACGLFAILSMLVSYYAYGEKHGAKPAEIGLGISLRRLGKTILLDRKSVV